jgi:hypothetical protein
MLLHGGQQFLAQATLHVVRWLLFTIQEKNSMVFY